MKITATNDVLYISEESGDFNGGMTEDCVNAQLTNNGYNTYYWKSERCAKIDFIIQKEEQIIPIKVKSANNTRTKNLKVYMDL